MIASRRRSAASVALALALLAAACSHQGPREFDVTPQAESQAPPEAPAANLAGTWQFNPRESDQPGQSARGGMSGMPGGGGRGGSGGRGGIPGGGRPEGAPGARGGEGGSAAIVGASPRLVVTQTDSAVTFARPNGVAFTLYFDGREVTVAGRTEDEAFQVSGRWRGKRFEVRREISTQRTVTESFELSSNGTKLTVRTRISGQEAGASLPEMRRVYDRQRSGDGRQRAEDRTGTQLSDL